MRKILALILILFIYSCDKSEDDILLGTWNLSSIILRSSLDLNGDGTKNSNLLNEFNGCYEITYDFMHGGSLYITSKTSPFSIKDGKLVGNISECKIETKTASWTMNEAKDKLFIEYSENSKTEAIDISEFSKKFIIYNGFSIGMLYGVDISGDMEFTKD